MQLNYSSLKTISHDGVIIPDENLFSLPEKILQFGTGRLLRGLPDYYIDKANRNGIFNGRVVAVKSTSKGDVAAYKTQDNLYTLCEREIVDGQLIEKNTISAAISRVLIAQDEWQKVLECAQNKELKIIISNTTEVGIQLSAEDNIKEYPPKSFPGKLLAFLYERFIVFGGSEEGGMIIIPTELITDNGKKLKSVVIELAQLNRLEDAFIRWIEDSNYFCSSLVDRIVSIPDKSSEPVFEKELGYRDELLTVTELYSMWAIEGDKNIKETLSFHQADKGVIIEPDIDLYRELKLRLLNGPHTLTCGVAFLAGYDTVQHTMEDKLTEAFISDLMYKEINPAIPYDINQTVKDDYTADVLKRFRNPFMNHYWINITLNYSSKMRMRCIPLLLNYYKIKNTVPQLFSLAFAAYLLFMKAIKQDGKNFYGKLHGRYYLIDDEKAAEFCSLWQKNDPEEMVGEVLKNESLWGGDLTNLSGFRDAVAGGLTSIMDKGMKFTIGKYLATE